MYFVIKRKHFHHIFHRDICGGKVSIWLKKMYIRKIYDEVGEDEIQANLTYTFLFDKMPAYIAHDHWLPHEVKEIHITKLVSTQTQEKRSLPKHDECTQIVSKTELVQQKKYICCPIGGILME